MFVEYMDSKKLMLFTISQCHCTKQLHMFCQHNLLLLLDKRTNAAAGKDILLGKNSFVK